MKINKDTLYSLFLVFGVIISNLIYSVLTHQVDLLGSVAGISGVICVVLAARGSIWNYLFGVVNVSLYALISFKSELYGDAGLNALYYLPMQFIGLWQWRKRGAAALTGDGETLVKARRLTNIQRLCIGLGSVLLVLVGVLVLGKLGDPQPLKDSTTTILSIIAQVLMAMAFMEQWFLWAIVNSVSIVMWVICALRGDEHAAVMIIMWVFYLLNSLNGMRQWIRLSREF